MAFILELGFHASNRSFPFPDKASADAALAELQPKIGARLYGDNGERLKAHSIDTPSGRVVIDLEKLEMAAVVDLIARSELIADDIAKSQENLIDYEVRRRQALLAVKAPDAEPV